MISENIIDYGQAISRWTTGYVGRQWLRREVDAFLSASDQRCFLLSGEPGVGKTAFLAQLAVERPHYLHHFVSAQESNWDLPAAFVQSVGAQLGLQFGMELLGEDEPPAELKVHQDIGRVASGATVVGVIIEQFTALPVEDMAQRLILRPVERLAKRKQGPVILLVDGLEEAAAYSGRPNIAELIVRLASAPNLRIVASSNPGPALQHLALELGGAGLRHLPLDEGSAENMADLRAYLDAALAAPEVRQAAQAAGLTRDELADRLLERSDGNFLYLTTVVNAIRRGPAQVDMRSLPDSLAAFYRLELARRKAEVLRAAPRAWRTEYRPVLGALAVARAPLALDALADLAGTERDVAAEVLDSFALLVDRREAAGQPVYRWYHHAVGDFLLSKVDNPDDWFDPTTYHQQIAERLHARFPDAAAIDNDYALQHLAAHDRLAGPEAWPRLFALVDPAIRRAWRATTGADQAYLGALTEAVMAASTMDPQQALPQVVQLGLVGATLRSTVATVPPELLRELARQGQWRRAVALAQSAVGSRGPALQAVVQGLLDQGHDQALATARQIAAMMPASPDEATHRALALGQIARRLADSRSVGAAGLFDEAGRAAEAGAGLDTQARALARLGRLRHPSDPAQAAKLFDQALSAARAMTAVLDEQAFEGVSAANLVAQTAIEVRHVARRTPYDTIGAKARALADVAAELAAVGDPRAAEVFAEVDALLDQVGLGHAPAAPGQQQSVAGGIFLGDTGIEAAAEVFREHTLEYIASRRRGLPEDVAPAPIDPQELERLLQASEKLPPDEAGFYARALIGLAEALLAGGDPQRARVALARAEAAAEGAAGGFRAELWVHLAGLWRALGQEDMAIVLDQKALALAEDEADFGAQYRAWLAQRGRQVVVDLAEVAMVRGAIQKRRHYSDRALAQMAQSLAVEDAEQALRLARDIGDPQQWALAYAAVAGHLALGEGAGKEDADLERRGPREGDAAPERLGPRVGEMVQEILDRLEPLPGDQRDLAINGAVEVLARLDPSRAQRLAEAIGDGASRAVALTLVAGEPASSSGEATARWEAAWQAASQPTTQTAESGATWARALTRLAAHWASTGDPRAGQAWDRAERAALAEPWAIARVEALSGLAEALRSMLPERARHILAQAEADARREGNLRGRSKSLGGIAASWMLIDPARACQLLADLWRLGRPNFLDGVARIAPRSVSLGGVALAWRLVEALDAAEGFFAG